MDTTELLYKVASTVTTGWELTGSRWGNVEAELIACQTICACALNHREHGDAFSWQGISTQRVFGGGLADNPKGMQSLIDDDCITLEPYAGSAYPDTPDDIVRNNEGQFMVLRVTEKLLTYAARVVEGNAARLATANEQS